MKKLLWVVFVALCDNALAQNSDYGDIPGNSPKPNNPQQSFSVNVDNQTQPFYYQPRSAVIDEQEAYSMRLDNELKSVETFWHIHDIYRDRQKKKFEEIQKRRDAY